MYDAMQAARAGGLLDAAVDCYGGFVVATAAEGHPLHGSPPLAERAGDLSSPLLGLFGADDEFHSYDGAGHAFMQVDRPNYRPEAAVDAWQHIWSFFGRYL